MPQIKSWARKAREASGLSPEYCACVLGVSRPTYDLREKEPGLLKLDDVVKLFSVYSIEGKHEVWEYIKQFEA